MNFESETFTEALKLMRTEHQVTSPYHKNNSKQANQFHKTLEECLSAYVSDMQTTVTRICPIENPITTIQKHGKLCNIIVYTFEQKQKYDRTNRIKIRDFGDDVLIRQILSKNKVCPYLNEPSKVVKINRAKIEAEDKSGKTIRAHQNDNLKDDIKNGHKNRNESVRRVKYKKAGLFNAAPFCRRDSGEDQHETTKGESTVGRKDIA
uniref:Integrase catalytic domain-containing protein n=1 Tax=Heterorhabditis bacteriophora TaxID=37862 RepID=A0A1I7WJ12_HETBA